MHKKLKLKAAIGGAMMCALAAGGATAQTASNSQLMSVGLKDAFSAADVVNILGEFPIATEIQPDQGDGMPSVVAMTPGGAKFIISLFQCDDPAQGAGCKGAAIFTGYSNAGITYDELNAFNSDANVTRVVNMSEQNLIIFGTQIFFSGGVGRANFKFVIELFMSDMQKYVETKAELGTSVSLEAETESRGKISNLTAGAEADDATPPFLRTNYDIDAALNAAISNTWDVSFTGDAE